MKKKKLLKGMAFVAIFVILFACAAEVLVSTGDYRNFHRIAGFYEEEENTLDAVYISSSTAYAYWNALVAWEQYGIAVFPYSCNSMHFVATEYLIREVRKTQPDALFIVNTNNIDEGRMDVEMLHFLLDDMPFSLNKLQLTKYLADTAGLTAEESIELYFPMYRYHVRWSDLHLSDFLLEVDGLKGVSYYETYLDTSIDLTDVYTYAEGREQPEDYVLEALESLMDYCEQENVRILFVTVPRIESEERIRQTNEINAILEERGFDTLQLLDDPETLGIDLTQDFYNYGHTNLHGSVKYTQYLSEYIIDRYGLEDKRGNETYASWDAGYQEYKPLLEARMLDLEYDLSRRTLELEQPAALEVSAAQESALISWASVEGAQGYAVYRKGAENVWQRIAETTELQYADTEVQNGTKYTYRVVPFVTQGDRVFYGKFDYAGVRISLP